MIDHISLRVRDFNKAIAFYKAALGPLGYKLLMEFEGFAGFGEHKPDFWVTVSKKAINPTHIAFTTDRKSVRAFHEAAVKAGGKDNGAPGPRADYHPNYFGAFVLDPDGNNVEAVCHEPEKAAKKPAAKKPAAKKPATKKPAAKKPARK
jgi:catechol 2,3-dioxygenase-like lactoylglutathione lyase family enzyme